MHTVAELGQPVQVNMHTQNMRSEDLYVWRPRPFNFWAENWQRHTGFSCHGKHSNQIWNHYVLVF